MATLDELTVDDFKSAVGSRFSLGEGDGPNVELEIAGAEAHTPDADAAAKDESGKRTPFSVDLRGPLEPILPQQIYSLVHADLGTLEIFIVPVGVDAAGTRYEAIFA
jgi:hypothetical protein